MEQEEGEMEASSPMGSTTDEETDDDSEQEPPLVVRRKVSFADAFGLNLVSVKEFDNADLAESEVIDALEREATNPLEEFYMSCLFTTPSSPEELDQRLEAEMVELESIGLLPGTTTLRGIIKVANLCYNKSVYARISLDQWKTYFDLLAEYVPGSSDRKTDKFAFMYTMVPPFEKGGTRLEFCLRYETEVGTFWANNKDMNYVLFCHQRVQGPPMQEESAGHKGKRSCLIRTNRRGSAEEKTRDTINTVTVAAEADAPHEAVEADRKTMDSAEIQSLLYHEEHKPLVGNIRSRHRVARLARVQDIFQRRQQELKPKPISTTWDNFASSLEKRHKKPSNESSQVLTYHQIPLLTLDWNNDKPQQCETADKGDIWTGTAKMSKASEEPSVDDMWEAFLNGTDDTTSEETSVCDVWQAFLHGPSYKDHSAVPESEWLQTAMLVSPPNDKEPQTQYVASNQEHEFQLGTDTPTTLQAPTSTACQLLSDTRETSLANTAINVNDQQPAEECVSRPRDDNTVTQEASQRSQTNSVTDTLQEFSLRGATPVSEGSVDSSTECHKQAIQEQEREGIIREAGGIRGDESSMPHTADLVTSSGESETTDMTAMPESQNASTDDRISRGTGLDQGLSYSQEEEVTGTAHNAMDNTLAFRETIRLGTKDGERFVFSAPTERVEEGITTNCTENNISTEEEIFRPECEISQRYADEKQCEEVSLNQNGENALKQNENDENEKRPAQSHADEFNLNQTCQKNIRQSQMMENESKVDESESEDAASNNSNVDGFGQKEVETSDSTTSEKTKRLIGEAEMIQLLDKEAEEVLCLQKEEEDRTQAQESEIDEHVSVSNQTDKGISLSYSGIIQEKQVFDNDHDTFRPSPKDKCNPNQMEVEMRWTHSQEHIKGHEHVGSEIRTREVTVKENVAKKDTSTKLQHQPETLKRIEEDMSQRDRAERVSIGKLEIEAVGELMGNVENPQGKSENAPAEVKELSAEVESSPLVEYKNLSEGTKDPITTENTIALEVIGSGLEEMLIDRFGEDLVNGIWEDVFDNAILSRNSGELSANGSSRMGRRMEGFHDYP
ncbi:protein phosphatase 1 regulatory subunit 3A [Scomber japonicus]|uniref:protein phosphatase 1 regulatory subunit 3A n=1 Tax=Scomber japonicus TaxID=13676 RepID=UPI00230645A6|nr:protein phosphatase 1 regulatory subunit 3A [Scomber japonicus]